MKVNNINYDKSDGRASFWRFWGVATIVQG